MTAHLSAVLVSDEFDDAVRLVKPVVCILLRQERHLDHLALRQQLGRTVLRVWHEDADR